MDFFGEQQLRTRRSLLLYGLFVLIVLLHMAVALGIMALLLTLFTGGIYYWALVLVTLWTLFSFIAGSFLEYRRLRAGGRAIAQRVGAVRLFIDSSQNAWEHSQGVAHEHQVISSVRYSSRHIAVSDERHFPPVYKRYYEFAEQLAIASGLSTPILYVMPEEQGINAFVAGRESQDTVLVVTQGALDKLSDEALYGLIGHEYGHILHGDAKFNLQLMVVLAGLQLLYDWSDPIENMTSGRNKTNNYFEHAVNQNKAVSQKDVEAKKRNIEAQTSGFTTHSEWVTYWQNQSQDQHASAKIQSKWLSAEPSPSREAPRNILTLLLHGLSFSSMASAQLIKHSFNRERELLADATSVQLTRSPAILETLKAIHQDEFGSRLSGIADINGLSHFFFASSGSDLSDVSWFATHPSLAERMSAINASEYKQFAKHIAEQQQVNQVKIREIYEQRRLGDWGEIKTKSLNKASSSTLSPSTKLKPEIDNQPSDDTPVLSDTDRINQVETDDGLEFTLEDDVIIDGRLQAKANDATIYGALYPWQAKKNTDLPSDGLVSATDIQKVSLPHYILNHSYHPLGALALIESVLLCHQHHELSTIYTYSLVDIWCGLPDDFLDSSHSLDKAHKIQPHNIDAKLLDAVASLDRRMDSALIALALKHLSQHDLSSAAIDRLCDHSENSHTHSSHQLYQQQQQSRMMLLRYQQGLRQLFATEIVSDLTVAIDTESANFLKKTIPKSDNTNSKAHINKAEQALVLSLWQALHLQQLLPVLSKVLGVSNVESNNVANNVESSYATVSHSENSPVESSHSERSHVDSQPTNDSQSSYQQLSQKAWMSINTQLDPSRQLSANTPPAEQMIMTLFAYRLGRSATIRPDFTYERAVADLRRYARLIEVDLVKVDDANLQWLLLTAQSLNSIQLLALVNSVTTLNKQSLKSTSNDAHSYIEQQSSAQLDYNRSAHNDYRSWLRTLHTVMLHDTIVSQDEYDCLTLLAEFWLGVRQLFE